MSHSERRGGGLGVWERMTRLSGFSARIIPISAARRAVLKTRPAGYESGSIDAENGRLLDPI